MIEPPRVRFEVGDAEEPPSRIQAEVQDVIRFGIAGFIMWAFVGGLTVIGLLFFAVLFIEAFAPKSVDAFLNFENLIMLLTTFGTLIAGPIGYVLGHYFPSRR